jgi:hypothetical protein
MDYTDLMQAVGSVGFPIVACCALFKLYQDFSQTLQQISATMKAIEIRLEQIEESASKMKEIVSHEKMKGEDDDN